MIVPYKKTRPDAHTPYRAHASDAGLDIAPMEAATLIPGITERLDTGLAFELPPGHVGLIAARSSTTLLGLAVYGVVDCSYRGPISLLVTNTGLDPVTVKAGQRLAQLIVVPCITPQLQLTTEIGPGERGLGAFGSTGR